MTATKAPSFKDRLAAPALRALSSPTALNLLRRLPPETAHGLTLAAMARGLTPATAWRPDPRLSQTVWGLAFASPLGVAAGFDKNAEAVDGVLDLGAGFVEVGGVTPRPQKGNPRPRVFRLAEDRAIINRLGFNNEGHDVVADRLRARRARGGLVGVNIGANKNSVDREADYVRVLRHLWGLADFFTLNVSSPNTEGLRALQAAETLRALLERVLAERSALASESGASSPVLVKLAPDLDPTELSETVTAALEIGVDGLILTNTTIARPEGLQGAARSESGGLSGRPLKEKALETLRTVATQVAGRVPLIGVGGIETAADAYARIRAGASLLQLYTALVYEGPVLFQRIPDGLAGRMAADGFASITEAIGADLR